MKKQEIILFCLFLLFTYGIINPQFKENKTISHLTPEIKIHYLGHSSFIFTFDNNKTILIDYGVSNAYGLDSPIFEIGNFIPSIVLYTHHDADHDRGLKFDSSMIVDGKDYSCEGIEIKAIPVTERKANDNVGYLICYKGIKIFHAGDSQGNMVSLSDAEVRKAIKEHIPERIDLLLIPIGWVKDIVKEAAAYAKFLNPKRLLPMHYWSADEKKRFLEILSGSGSDFMIDEKNDPIIEIISNEKISGTKIIKIKPADFIEGTVRAKR